jgi:hypothetical protein
VGAAIKIGPWSNDWASGEVSQRKGSAGAIDLSANLPNWPLPVVAGHRSGEHFHPTTSGNSHLLDGVFLGVSHSNQTKNFEILDVFSSISNPSRGANLQKS